MLRRMDHVEQGLLAHKPGDAGRIMIQACAIVVLIGVIAAMVMPAYTTESDVSRSQLRRGLPAIDAAKRRVEWVYEKSGRFPQNNAEAKLIPPEGDATKVIGALSILDDGVILVTIKSVFKKIDGQEIRLIPTVEKGRLHWQCATALPGTWLPRGVCEEEAA